MNMTERKQLEKDIESILEDTSYCAEYCKSITCSQCEAKRITDYIFKREKEDEGYIDGQKEMAKSIIGILNVEKGLRSNVVTDYQDRIDNVINFIKKELCKEI